MVMRLLQDESQSGYFEVYLSDSGERYIVLEGLDVNQIHTPGIIETYLLKNYDSFEMMYWGMFTVTFVYLLGTYIILPLYWRLKNGPPLFSEQ
jgi:hypothetical protein